MSSFEPDGESFSNWANDNAQPYKRLDSTLGEVFQANIGMQIDEMNSNSAYNGNRMINLQKQRIRRNLKKNGLGEAFIDSYTTRVPGQGYNIDWDSLSTYVNDNLDPDEEIESISELVQTRDRELSTRRDYYNDVMSKATTTKGLVGGIAGSVTGMSLDPLNAVIAPLSIPLVGIASTSRAMYTASNVIRAGTFNAAAAVPFEPFIHSWKEEIGADDYGVKESFQNIFLSGVLGGTVSGVGANIGYKYSGKSFMSKDRPSLVQSFKDLGIDPDDAEILAQAQYEINNNPDRKMDVRQHAEILETKQEDLNTRVAKDVEPDIDYDNDSLLQSQYDREFGDESIPDVNLSIEGVETPSAKLINDKKNEVAAIEDDIKKLSDCNAAR